jgi:D-alanyl-D-alanine endopeptidase (penicillin-binding protein 7)
MVFLDSKGRLSHVGDAARMRKWLVDDQPNLTRVKMVRADEG